jgi:hypothetical protein
MQSKGYETLGRTARGYFGGGASYLGSNMLVRSSLKEARHSSNAMC